MVRTVVLSVASLCVLSGLCVLCGCGAVVSGVIPEPAPPRPTGALQVGAARVDITPPPGFPLGGHSIAGKVGRGYWTRLQSRCVYVEDADGRGLALVACELWSMPAGLGDRVAELLAGWAETAHLGRERLLIAATHTHQSPGNFSTSEAYNAFATPRSGFDRRLFEFLAHRIARSVRAACASAEPARVLVSDTRIEGLARNRSMPAFWRNPESARIVGANADLPEAEPTELFPDPLATRAVDPTLQVLRAERPDGRVLAIAGFVAVHPTVMSHDSEIYNGDLFGVASILAERDLRTRGPDGPPPVVALFNGAEGDVSPDWRRQDRLETERLGGILAAGLSVLARGGGVEVSGAVEARYAIARVPNRRFVDRDGVPRRTSRRAVPGVGTLGGAEDGRTLFWDLGWVEGVTGNRTGGQGSKHPAFDPRFLPAELPFSLTDLISSFSPGPRDVPLAVYRVGSLALATLPGECTFVLGRRIRTALAERLGVAPDDVLLVGLAQEYLSYFTTPEEYEAQHYEGASTLYGPASGPLLAHDLCSLAGRPRAEPRARSYAYAAGAGATFTFREMGSAPYFEDDGLAQVLTDRSTGRPFRGFPSCTWTDVSRELPRAHRTGLRVTPRVAVVAPDRDEVLAVDGRAMDDAGLCFVTVGLEATRQESRWVCFWMPPDGFAGRFRFRIERLDGTTRYSEVRAWPPPQPPGAGR